MGEGRKPWKPWEHFHNVAKTMFTLFTALSSVPSMVPGLQQTITKYSLKEGVKCSLCSFENLQTFQHFFASTSTTQEKFLKYLNLSVHIFTTLKKKNQGNHNQRSMIYIYYRHTCGLLELINEFILPLSPSFLFSFFVVKQYVL